MFDVYAYFQRCITDLPPTYTAKIANDEQPLDAEIITVFQDRKCITWLSAMLFLGCLVVAIWRWNKGHLFGAAALTMTGAVPGVIEMTGCCLNPSLSVDAYIVWVLRVELDRCWHRTLVPPIHIVVVRVLRGLREPSEPHFYRPIPFGVRQRELADEPPSPR